MKPTLEQRFYRLLSTGPIGPQDQDLYIDLEPARGSTNAVKRIAQKIRFADGETCQVLAGHRGSGKSTELLQLKEALEHGTSRFHVVLCKADEHLDRNDVDFPDLLIALVRQVAADLRQRASIELKPGYFKDRLTRLGKLLLSDVDFGELELDAGLGKLAIAIKGSPEARHRVREALEPDAGNLLGAANDVLSEAVVELRKQSKAGLVVLFDDLDKMVIRPLAAAGCLTSEHLFVNRAAQLRGFKCHVVYTLPIELAYSHNESAIRNSYGGNVPVLPMTKLRTKPPARNVHEVGLELFRELLRVRIAKAGGTLEQVFASVAVRDDMILLSGGQPDELMRLLSEALVAAGLPITADALARLRREGGREYTRQLTVEHHKVLDEVRRTGGFQRSEESDKPFRELLSSRAILQYVNDDEWYDVNPLVPASS